MSIRYRLYLDESGDHVFHDEKTLRQPGHRYLGLLGCFLAREEYVSFQGQLTELVDSHFPHDPDEAVSLHRSDIINRKGPFWRLRDEGRRTAFEESLVALLRHANFIMIIIIIDKFKLIKSYLAPWHPYHTALGFMLQRYCGYLNHMNARGDVMAESRGRREDEFLANAYNHIYVHGDRYHRAPWHQRVLTSSQLKLKKKSANIAGLQLADILAHPVKQTALYEYGRIVSPEGVFGARLSGAVNEKYNRHLYDGRVEGYGRLLFPK